MDPQQCLLLDCTMMALQDAGITREEIAGSNTAVFVGAMNSDCSAGFVGCTSKVDNYTATNIGTSIMANRVSHVFDLRGPSMVLDTACSASLIAIHLGCQAILSGDSDMAICGGVNVMTLPDMFVHLSKAGMISPSGLCHTFSKNADGYTRGEGCGVVILKRLRTAQRKGDKLWATVSTGTNQDGREERLLTNPSGVQQKKLLESVYSKSDVSVDDVDYIEAHGTGTPAGDPVEVNALGSFFKENGRPRDRYIGSVKTNIGHTESAAGVLSIIKVLLMMKHGKIVPSLHCAVDEVNPDIDLAGLGLNIPRVAVPWDNENKTAGCNSFGFGGSNCHTVLKSAKQRAKEENKQTVSSYRQGEFLRRSSSSLLLQSAVAGTSKPDARMHSSSKRKLDTHSRDFVEKKTQKTLLKSNDAKKPDSHFLVCFSGKTSASLKKSLEDVQGDSEALKLNIRDIAYTSTVRRDHFSHRAAFLAEDMQDLHTQIDKTLLELESAPPSPRKSKPDIVFVFCGMVPVWKGMCRELLQNGSFKDGVQEVEKHLKNYVSWSLTDRLLKEDPSQDSVLGPISIFACQVGLLEMWRGFGVRPHCVVGQSIGEVTAAYAAGCLSLADAVKIIYQRSRLLAKVTGGAMLLVQNVDVGKIHELLQTLQGKATVALEYSPRSCTISVDADVVHTLEQQLKGKNITYRHLALSVAYHSHHVEPCLQELEECIGNIKPQPPADCNFISTVTGSQVDHPLNKSHWIKNVRDSVLFGQAIEAASNARKTADIAFVEIGPKPALQAHLKDIFPKKITNAIPSMVKSKERNSFLQAVRALYERGADIKFTGLYKDGSLTYVPRYQFDRKNKREKTETDLILQDGIDVFRKNHPFVLPIRASCTEFSLLISPLSTPSIYDHVLSRKVVIPGAFYVESAFAVVQYTDGNQERHHVSVSAQFLHPLTVKKHEVTTLKASIQSPKKADSLQTTVLVHKSGRHLAELTISSEEPSSPQTVNVQHLLSKCNEEMTKEEIYAALRQSGFQYGETFRLLQGARKSSSESIAEIKVHETLQSEIEGTCIHPTILDSMLQSSLTVMKGSSQSGSEVLPSAIERLVVLGPMETNMLVHTCLKAQNLKGLVLDQRLLSSTGRVIAELTGLKIQFLTPHKTVVPIKLISAEWQEIGKLKQDGLTQDLCELSKAVVFCDAHSISGRLQCQTISYKDRLHLPEFLEEVAATLRSSPEISRVCLLYSEPITEEMDGTLLQSQLISLTCLIQIIAKELIEKNYKIPFYLCTLNAWPSPTRTRKELEVNPVATALWGLLRTVVVEQVFPHVTAVELHLPPGELTSDLLQSSLGALEAEEKTQNCPEILLTGDSLFTNCLEELREISLPDHRKQDGKHKVGIPLDAVILCKEASASCDLIAMTRKQNSFDGSRQKLKLHAFVQPSTDFLALSLPPTSLTLDGSPSTHNKVMMALEVVGQTVDDSEKQVVSCCPTPVSAETTVPVETTVPLAALPEYQPGDLSKIVLLWQLCKGILTDRATILTSESSKHLAKCLTLMCPGKSIHTVVVERLDDEGQELSETIVSLALLDSNVMVDVRKYWRAPKRLVACSSFLTTEARTFLSCEMPDVELCLHDTQLMFQSRRLYEVVPQVKVWLEANEKEMVDAAKALHFSTNGSNVNDLNQLFGFKCVKMTDISVQLLSDKLFRKDSSYIVVGGLSGLGWMCVEFLAENSAGYIAIVNRSAPSDEKKEDMANVFAANQCRIKSFQADITSVESLRCTLQAIQQDSGLEIRGVFTGAAVLVDSIFNKLERSQFEKVMAPKVLGTWNLHLLTKDMPLDYFVMHSSVASVLGNLGQANYSAANAFQDGLAYYRRHHGLVAQTINWGPLDTGLLDNQDATKKKLKSMGFHIATEQEIRQTLKTVLLLNRMQSVPVTLDYDVYCQKLYNTDVPSLMFRMRKLTSPSDHTHTHGASVAELDGGILRAMEAGPERLQACEQYVTELTRRVLGEDHAHISLDANLIELGVDSVTGMMMLNVIHRDTSFNIPAVEVFADATIASLARAIDNCIQEAKNPV